MSSKLLDSPPQSPRDDGDDENPFVSSSVYSIVFFILSSRPSEYKVAASSNLLLETEFIILFSNVFPSSAIARAATPRRPPLDTHFTPNPSVDPPVVLPRAVVVDRPRVGWMRPRFQPSTPRAV